MPGSETNAGPDRAVGGGPVVGRLLDWTRREGFASGAKLPNIRRLAEILGASPSEVRDALLQAQTMGRVRILPRSGAYVQSPTYETLVGALGSTVEAALAQADPNLFHLLDARRLLEVELAGRAAAARRLEGLLPVRRALEAMASVPEGGRRGDYVEADILFHAEIARLADNAVLATIHRALLGGLRPYLVQLPWPPGRRQLTDASHARLYAALVAGDAEEARSAMAAHLDLAYRSLLREIESVPAGPETRTLDPAP